MEPATFNLEPESTLERYITAALILGLAVWAIVAREAYAAVVGFIAYGLLLTLVWVQLHGIDVALTEAAIGGGLTGALLIGAAARLRSTGTSRATPTGSRWPRSSAAEFIVW